MKSVSEEISGIYRKTVLANTFLVWVSWYNKTEQGRILKVLASCLFPSIIHSRNKSLETCATLYRYEQNGEFLFELNTSKRDVTDILNTQIRSEATQGSEKG